VLSQANFMGPKVIDDDEFETKLAAIIERDYFPDIKRLQNRLEWTHATESGDVDQIANAQRNIVLRRAGFSVRISNSARAWWSTPAPHGAMVRWQPPLSPVARSGTYRAECKARQHP
jgi:hypothetical protein